MKISVITCNYNHINPKKQNKTTFNSWNREVLRDASLKLYDLENVKHRNDTRFFRNGNFWKQLVDLLVKKYKNFSFLLF